MSFSVEKIAQLAYLSLTDDEKKSFDTQFKGILSYVDQLQKVPMSAEEAKAMGEFHISSAFYKQLGLSPSITLRDEDQMEEVNSLTLTNEEALSNAPQTGGIPGELLFEVPSIISK
ncbi:MAG: aspartyl/glutamyl-tRNA amidotransferase subunit C [Deltaproteobacteria bacterium]|nr:aspartyl/glutamyl-tRNA amidotransferase subunit C [Deltaproteobacteria bacterium]